MDTRSPTLLSFTSRRSKRLQTLVLFLLLLVLTYLFITNRTQLNEQPVLTQTKIPFHQQEQETVQQRPFVLPQLSLNQYLFQLDTQHTIINTLLNETLSFTNNPLSTLITHVQSTLPKTQQQQSASKDLRVHGSSVGTVQQFGTSLFGFLDLDRGNVSPSTSPTKTMAPVPTNTPVQQQQGRKRGLLAMPVSGRVKNRVKSIIEKFKSEDMDVLLFHYDDVEWTDVQGYEHVSSVRVKGQTKFWYSKRFVVPQLMDNYDYLFLWDDDIVLDDEWSPLQFVAILQHFAIHVAQPALHSGSHVNSLQHETVRLHVNNVEAGSPGRFSEFVEIMFPVFSREAWQNCIWETIPYDGFSYWGIDNIWYPHCSSMGYCRFAIIDVMSVGHLDSRSLRQRPDKNLRELSKFLNLYRDGLCIARPTEVSDWTSYLRALCICHYLRHFPPGRSFRWITPIVPSAHGGPLAKTHTCVEPHLWPGISNRPWYGDDKSEPVPVSL